MSKENYAPVLETIHMSLNVLTIKAGVNLKFAQKLSFLFFLEFLPNSFGILIYYGKINFNLFSSFLPF